METIIRNTPKQQCLSICCFQTFFTILRFYILNLNLLRDTVDMVSKIKSVDVVRILRIAGWYVLRKKGSHTVWCSSDRTIKFTVPDGHKEISAGVWQRLQKVLKERGEL